MAAEGDCCPAYRPHLPLASVHAVDPRSCLHVTSNSRKAFLFAAENGPRNVFPSDVADVFPHGVLPLSSSFLACGNLRVLEYLRLGVDKRTRHLASN